MDIRDEMEKGRGEESSLQPLNMIAEADKTINLIDIGHRTWDFGPWALDINCLNKEAGRIIFYFKF